MSPTSLHSPSRLFRAAPAIACLLYPAIVWCIPNVSAYALVLTLLVPAFCAYVAFQLAGSGYRMTSAVAHFGIGSPALYSFMGQWLDSLKLFPLHTEAAWAALWLILAILALFEQPKTHSVIPAPSRLAFIHGISAIPILLFAAIHLANHLAGLWGGAAHIAFMHRARTVYRYPVVEIALVACIFFQFATGLILTWRGISRGLADSWMKRLQRISGAYLAVFFLSHGSAVIRTRFLRHHDTNWHWLTADNLLTDAWSVRLTPYYFLGVVALSLHVACAARFVLLGHGMKEQQATRVFAAILSTGCVVAVAIMFALIRASLHG